MDKNKKILIFFTTILVLIDLLIVPHLINFFFMAKSGNAIAWPQSITLLGGLLLLPKVFPIWIWVQGIFIGVLLWFWFYGQSFVNLPNGGNNDCPPAAGHGQHGTSRWMSQKEIESIFTVRKM